jgi:hypothetical protein
MHPMKLFATLIIGCLLLSSSNAQNSALFTVGTTGNFNLKMTFNGKNYSLYDKTVTFQNVTPGTFPVVLYQAQRNADGTFGYKQVYDGNITLTAGRHLEVMVMRYGKMVWDEGDYSGDGWTNAWVNPGPTNGSVNNANSQAMSDENFAYLLNLFSRESNEYRRLEIAPGYMKNNLFTARQIATLCKTFSNEYRQLDFAKLAFPYCSEKGSYFVVADTFTNQYRRQELMDFVAKQN